MAVINRRPTPCEGKPQDNDDGADQDSTSSPLLFALDTRLYDHSTALPAGKFRQAVAGYDTGDALRMWTTPSSSSPLLSPSPTVDYPNTITAYSDTPLIPPFPSPESRMTSPLTVAVAAAFVTARIAHAVPRLVGTTQLEHHWNGSTALPLSQEHIITESASEHAVAHMLSMVKRTGSVTIVDYVWFGLAGLVLLSIALCIPTLGTAIWSVLVFICCVIWWIAGSLAEGLALIFHGPLWVLARLWQLPGRVRTWVAQRSQTVDPADPVLAIPGSMSV